MKMCFITATMAGGGTERVIAALSNYFVKKGNDVTILMTAGNTVEYELNENVKVIQIGNETGGAISGRLQRIYSLRKFFLNNKDTVYLSFGTETNMFAILSSFFLKRKLIVSERNDPNKCSFVYKRNFLYRFADKLVFQTQDAMDCFPQQISRKGKIIPNPISDFIPEKYNGERRKEVVAVGRLEEQKNHKLLLESFYDFAKCYEEYILTIYGKGSLRQELEKHANDLCIKEKVVFADFAPDVLERIKDSYMYVLSSDYEGISNSLLEAMGLGLPVISTKCPIGGYKMLIKNYENGILVPVGDRKALAMAMMQLAEDKDLAEKISNNAVKTRDEYSLEKIAKMWEEYIVQ